MGERKEKSVFTFEVPMNQELTSSVHWGQGDGLLDKLGSTSMEDLSFDPQHSCVWFVLVLF